jgi:hypothetical protein
MMQLDLIANGTSPLFWPFQNSVIMVLLWMILTGSLRFILTKRYIRQLGYCSQPFMNCDSNINGDECANPATKRCKLEKHCSAVISPALSEKELAPKAQIQ